MSELTATRAATAACNKRVNRIPLSTYRLQLVADLTLDQVHDLLPYLQKLGISDLYLSPLFRARAESSQGHERVDRGTRGEPGAAMDLASSTPARSTRRLATSRHLTDWQVRLVKRTWGFCSMWCRTTWVLTTPEKRGGSTFWRTARV